MIYSKVEWKTRSETATTTFEWNDWSVKRMDSAMDGLRDKFETDNFGLILSIQIQKIHIFIQ